MYVLKTEKQLKYFDEVIRLHFEKGYGEDRISSILPIGHSTVSRWISIFVSCKGKGITREDMSKNVEKKSSIPSSRRLSKETEELLRLRRENSELTKQLSYEKMRADAYDEMINVAEAMFEIPIRKKVGAKR